METLRCWRRAEDVRELDVVLAPQPEFNSSVAGPLSSRIRDREDATVRAVALADYEYFLFLLLNGLIFH